MSAFPLRSIAIHAGDITDRFTASTWRARRPRSEIAPAIAFTLAANTTGNPDVIMAGVNSLATHGTCSMITSSGAPVTVPPGALQLRGRKLRGTMGGHITPTVFIPRLLDLHARGRFPFDRLVRNYAFSDLQTAMDDSLSGETIKPVLTLT